MPDEEIKLLFKSLGANMFEGRPNFETVLMSLIRETVKFRDKLKEETGEVLTVADARAALDALETHLRGGALPRGLTSEQRILARILIDRISLFEAQ